MARATRDEKMYKIGEVCRRADVQPYVLRFWETEFPQLAPNKSGGGQRLYSEQEIGLILRIKELLYKEGFTIAGAKKKLEQELSEPPAVAPATTEPPVSTVIASTPESAPVRSALRDVRKELAEILRILER